MDQDQIKKLFLRGGLIITAVSLAVFIGCYIKIDNDTSGVCPPGPLGEACMEVYYQTEGKTVGTLLLISTIALLAGLVLLALWVIFWFMSKGRKTATQPLGTVNLSDQSAAPPQAGAQVAINTTSAPADASAANVSTPPQAPVQAQEETATASFCPECGAKADTGDRFCIDCGGALS